MWPHAHSWHGTVGSTDGGTLSGAATAGDLAPVAPVAWPVAPVLVDKASGKAPAPVGVCRAADHLFDIADLPSRPRSTAPWKQPRRGGLAA